MTEHQHGAPGVAAEGPGPYAAPEPPADGKGQGAAPGTERLRRDTDHKVVGGVCAGLGRYYDMDPVIFRIVLAVLSVTGGLGLVFYGFAWLLLPTGGGGQNEAKRLLSGRVDGAALTAVVCALVGCGLFLSMLRNSDVLTFATGVAVLLTAASYWSRQRRDAPAEFVDADVPAGTEGTPKPQGGNSVYGAAPPEPQAPPVPGQIKVWWQGPLVKDGTHVGGTGYLWGPPELDPDFLDGDVRTKLGPRGTQRSVRRRGPRWISGWVVLLALLTGAGTAAGLWDAQLPRPAVETALAAALLVLGLGVTLSSVLGRTGAGTLVLGALTAGALAATAALPADVTADWVRTTWRPAEASQVRSVYELGTGDARLDLSRLDVPRDRTVATHVEVGAGRLTVTVPADATVLLHTEVGLGDVRLPGPELRKDVDIAPGREVNTTLRPPSGTPQGGTVRIDLEVGLGQVVVNRAAS